MSEQEVYISGITPQSDLPKDYYKYTYRELCNTEKLVIPSNKLDIQKILEASIRVSAVKVKKIYTNNHGKLFINGILDVNIFYSSNESYESLNSVEFKIPVGLFIPVSDNLTRNIVTKIYIEDVFIEKLSSRSFYISTLILVCPVGLKESKENSNYEKFSNKNFKNNINNSKGIEINLEYDMNNNN